MINKNILIDFFIKNNGDKSKAFPIFIIKLKPVVKLKLKSKIIILFLFCNDKKIYLLGILFILRIDFYIQIKKMQVNDLHFFVNNYLYMSQIGMCILILS